MQTEPQSWFQFEVKRPAFCAPGNCLLQGVEFLPVGDSSCLANDNSLEKGTAVWSFQEKHLKKIIVFYAWVHQACKEN